MRNLLWLACVAVAATKGAHSHVDAALGGGGSRGKTATDAWTLEQPVVITG